MKTLPQELPIQYTRYATPQGNVWVAEYNGKRVAAREKRAAMELVLSTGDNGIIIGRPDNFSCGQVYEKTDSFQNPPMLIVGACNFTRNAVPFFLLQKYDLHLFLKPEENGIRTVQLLMISRIGHDKTQYVTAKHKVIGTAVDNLFMGAVLAGKNLNEFSEENDLVKIENKWLTNWIYRCPKISLKDVLHLPDYKGE